VYTLTGAGKVIIIIFIIIIIIIDTGEHFQLSAICLNSKK